MSGARQSGKTTLLRQLAEQTPIDLRTFDDPQELSAAEFDPKTYVEQLVIPTAVDEFQRAGDSFLLSLKACLDKNRTKGQFVLAGSTSFLTSKRIADSLAGRVGILELWPLSVGEIRSVHENFIEQAFQRPAALAEQHTSVVTRAEVAQLIVNGGFPEAQNMNDRARNAWFRSYLATIATKDVIDEVGDVRKLTEFRRVLDLSIARTAQEANAAAISADAGLHPSTVAHHLELLRNLMVLHEVPAWANSATTRAKRHPKRYAVDSGLAASVLGTDAASLTDARSPLFGQLFETFVVNELAKQKAWLDFDVRLHHFRDAGSEIDLLLVGPGERIVAIEVKSSATVNASDARHIVSFRDRIGGQFVHGYVLYLGSRTLPLANDITALPVSALWTQF